MALLFAFSLQHQIEKYGAYVGLAAFLGLAVLTVLYFAQARELKRLRDWAGRAPERAQELEARVVAQADELRRVQAGTVGPAQPIPQPADASGNGRATGTPVPIPLGPRPAVAVAALAAKAQAGGVATEERPAAETAGAVVEMPDAPEAVPVGGETPAEDRADASPVDDQGAPPPEEQADAPADDRAAAGEAETDSEAEPQPSPAPEPVATGNGTGTSTQIPRATPRPQQPRPAPAAPLRAPARTATVASRRSAITGGDGSSRTARITLLTLLGVIVLAGVIFAATQILGGDEKPKSAPNVAQPASGSPSPSAPSANVTDQRPDTVVTVLNGTATDGLAGAVRDKLIAQGYSDQVGMIRTGNNSDQQRQDSVVLYAPGQRRMARDVAQILGIGGRPQAVDEDTLALANNTGDNAAGHATDVVVIAGPDQAD